MFRRFPFVIGCNVVGQLPDDAPLDCETWELARDSLIFDLERMDCDDDRTEGEAVAAVASLKAAASGEAWSFRVGACDLWIVAAETTFPEHARDNPPWSECGDRSSPDFGCVFARSGANGSAVLSYDREGRNVAGIVYDARDLGAEEVFNGRRFDVVDLR